MKRIFLAITLMVLLLVGGASFWIYKDLHTPARHTRSGQYIEIPRGSSPSSVIKILAAEGIIKHEWPLTIYLKLSGTGARFKSGEYNFSSPIAPLNVLARLQEGEQRLIRLTIVEGWARWDIASAMFKVPELKLADADSALP